MLLNDYNTFSEFVIFLCGDRATEFRSAIHFSARERHHLHREPPDRLMFVMREWLAGLEDDHRSCDEAK